MKGGWSQGNNALKPSPALSAPVLEVVERWTNLPSPITQRSACRAAGVHPKVVSEILGHASISITLDTYSHAIPTMQAEAAELVASLFLKGRP